MSVKKVLILYYSGSGNTKKMAKAIAEAMKPSSINVAVEDVGKFLSFPILIDTLFNSQ